MAHATPPTELYPLWDDIEKLNCPLPEDASDAELLYRYHAPPPAPGEVPTAALPSHSVHLRFKDRSVVVAVLGSKGPVLDGNFRMTRDWIVNMKAAPSQFEWGCYAHSGISNRTDTLLAPTFLGAIAQQCGALAYPDSTPAHLHLRRKPVLAAAEGGMVALLQALLVGLASHGSHAAVSPSSAPSASPRAPAAGEAHAHAPAAAGSLAAKVGSFLYGAAAAAAGCAVAAAGGGASASGGSGAAASPQPPSAQPYRGWRVLVCGHSQGAAIASLLAVHLRHRLNFHAVDAAAFPAPPPGAAAQEARKRGAFALPLPAVPVYAVGFGCPRHMGPDLAAECSRVPAPREAAAWWPAGVHWARHLPLLTSVMAGSDPIPRLTLGDFASVLGPLREKAPGLLHLFLPTLNDAPEAVAQALASGGPMDFAMAYLLGERAPSPSAQSSGGGGGGAPGLPQQLSPAYLLSQFASPHIKVLEELIEAAKELARRPLVRAGASWEYKDRHACAVLLGHAELVRPTLNHHLEALLKMFMGVEDHYVEGYRRQLLLKCERAPSRRARARARTPAHSPHAPHTRTRARTHTHTRARALLPPWQAQRRRPGSCTRRPGAGGAGARGRGRVGKAGQGVAARRAAAPASAPGGLEILVKAAPKAGV